MSEQPLTEFPRTDAQQVEVALRRLAPKWTTHVIHTIAKYGPELRWRDISQHLPELIPTNLSKRLAGMTEAGLLSRDAEFDRWAPFRLSSRARTLGPVYRELVQWSADHLPGAPTGRYDRIEDALQRLQLTGTTKLVGLLAENGRMRFTHLADDAGLPGTALTARLHRLQEDGLVTRTGPGAATPTPSPPPGAPSAPSTGPSRSGTTGTPRPARPRCRPLPAPSPTGRTPCEPRRHFAEVPFPPPSSATPSSRSRAYPPPRPRPPIPPVDGEGPAHLHQSVDHPPAGRRRLVSHTSARRRCPLHQPLPDCCPHLRGPR
ncbi:winged helix-turn-helix transcriptional regulator [Kitasatospora sp. NPDC097605]|uniref:winged helix-turn-helix transcriptional regulator n=1 Tax=Kitasatospora sp. NPDC097605 TaxID=3157226 RepID=UPI003323C123